MKIIECVPNFSEGRRRNLLEEIVASVRAVGGARMLDWSMDDDHNRSVLTFIGPPEICGEAALAACERALRLIDMRAHGGVHPRIGAVDVVPFIPFGEATMRDAVDTAHRFGRTFAERTGVPVYFYGAASLIPGRKSLAAIRRGQYERLKDKLCDAEWLPDAGPAVFNPCAGATAVGARKPLIAFNVNLASDNVELARRIARSIRESSGGFPAVMALGLLIASRNIAQVSMNLLDFERTSVQTVYDEITRQARAAGEEVLESELIGCLPRKALEGVTPEYLKLRNFGPERIVETHIESIKEERDHQEKP